MPPIESKSNTASGQRQTVGNDGTQSHGPHGVAGPPKDPWGVPRAYCARGAPIVRGNQHRSQHAVLICLLLAAAFVANSFATAAPADAATKSEQRMYEYIVSTRASYDRSWVRLSSPVSDIARAHSRKMRAKGGIYHSDLGYVIRSFGWTVAGENVGMGPSVYKLHKAFMASSGHKANILGRAYRRVGIGFAWNEAGTMAYVTVIFLNYS